jgi:hypothetical protein
MVIALTRPAAAGFLLSFHRPLWVGLCHRGLVDLSVRFTAHSRSLSILPRMRTRYRLDRLSYLLGNVFSMAMANCSGSVRSKWVYPKGGRPRTLICL